MTYKAIYDAESDIPNDVKSFYSIKDGKWMFKGSEFEGLAEMLNPSLAINRDNILEEKRKEVAKNTDLEAKISELTTELSKVKKPDSIVIEAADNKLLNEYKELGPIKDLKAKLENESALSTKLQSYETEKEVAQLAKKLNLDPDALVDFKVNSLRGKDVTLRIGKVKEKDSKGNEVEKDALMVVKTDQVNGKDKETEIPFTSFAQEQNYPKYILDGIFSSSVNESENKSKAVTTSTFRAPNSMKQQTKTSEDKKAPIKDVVSKFNQNRSTRTMPWTPKQKEETT